jgi:hypothetical protein
MVMEKDKVVKILKFYKTIDEEISLNESVIQELHDRYYVAVGAARLDGMPKGIGGVTSPVETTILNVPESAYNTIRELTEENTKLNKVKSAILKELNGLPYLYKAIIIEFYIRGLQWGRISEHLHYSERQCKNVRNYALERLSKKFNANKTISKFKFPA